jgi:cell wall-associated NlpC family hydrolase/SLT domain-containing protein
MMELVLHVNKDQAQRDINSLDGGPAGRKTGQQFGQSFSREQLTRMNAGMDRFGSDAARSSDRAGQQSGRSFGSAFSALTRGVLTSFFTRDAAEGIRAAERSGDDTGTHFASAFGQLTKGIVSSFFTGAAASVAARHAADSGSSSGRGWGAAFSRDATSAVSGFHNRMKADSARAGTDAGTEAGRGFGAAFLNLTRGLLGRADLGRVNLTGAGGGERGLLGGIGPGILGLSTRTAGIVGLGGAALGAVPALAAGGLGAGVAAGGAGALAAGFGIVQSQVTDAMKARTQAQQAVKSATTPAQQQAAQAKLTQANAQIRQLSPALQSIIASETKIQDTWEKFAKGLAPLVAGPLAQVARLFTSLTPVLHQFFAAAATLAQPLIGGLANLARQVLPLLGDAFRAAAPLLRPVLDGLTGIITGLLPGLIALLHAAGPAVEALFGGLARLGTSLGDMFALFTPVVTASAQILGSLFSVINSLLPVIAQLAGVFAVALAPVFSQFAGIVVSLLPFLVTLGRIVASLAGAILGDLVAAFGAVAALFRTIGPALNTFAKAISGVFTVLENSGVFAVLGDAVEQLAKPLGALIVALVRGLTPIIPPIVGLIARLAAILTAGLAKAIAALLPPLTLLVNNVLAALIPLLPVVIPLLTVFTQIFTLVLVRVITDLAKALNEVFNVVLTPGVLRAVAVGITAIWLAFKLFGLYSLVTNPIGLIIVAIGLLVVGIVELATHWHQVWTAITAAAQATGRFFTSLYRNQIVQDILAVWSLGLIPLAQHWTQVWAAISRTAVATWHAIYGAVLAPLISWFTVSLPHGLGVATNHVHQWWSDVANAFSGGYHTVFNNTLAPFIRFFTTTIPQIFASSLAGARQWWANIGGAFRSGWNAVWNNVIVPMRNLFTRDLPSWFSTAVSAVGRFWSNIYNSIRGPVVRVVDTVLNGIISVFDWITSHVGLGKPIKPIHPFGLAAGGKVGKVLSGTGPTADDVIVRVSRDETVVSAADSAVLAPAFAALGIPGYQAGGKVGQNPPVSAAQARFGPSVNAGGPALGPLSGILHKAADVVKITAAFATQNAKALSNAFSDLLGVGSGATGVLGQILTAVPKTLVKDLVGWLIGQGGASGSAIADYAMTFLGKIPYTWGGATLTAADCSGFVQAIYKHFGIQAPRTSEEQGAWVKRTGPQPGGLAFYHSPPGGADPGHVAIVRNALQVISQGGGMGPQLMNIHAMPLLWTGIPPGGLGAANKGGLYLGPGGSYQNDIQTVLRSLGLPLTLTRNWLQQIQTESGGSLTAVNRTDANARAGHPSVGLLQLVPSTFAAYAGPYRNAQPLVNYGGGPVSLNAMAQIYAAIHYANAVYHGAAMDQIIGHGHGYANGGWVNEPVTGVGKYSRALYHFAESGPEYVMPEGQVRGGDGTAALAGRLDRVIALLDAAPARTSAGVAQAVTAPQRTLATAARIGAR